MKRGAGRKRLRRMTWLAIVIAVVALGFGVTRSPLLAVRHIRVSGAQHTTAMQIRTAGGVATGAAMLDVSSGSVAKRIEALPWVADARVHRDWPQTLVIAITERKPSAALQSGSSWLVLDVDGRVLERRSSVPTGLVPVLWSGPTTGPGTTLSMPVTLLRLASAVPPELRGSVRGVALEGTSLVLRLDHGAEVRIGDALALRDKLVAAVTLLETPAASCAAVIDVQVPSAPTLTTRQGCA